MLIDRQRDAFAINLSPKMFVKLPLKSIALNLGNIYKNNIGKTRRLPAGDDGIRLELNV